MYASMRVQFGNNNRKIYELVKILLKGRQMSAVKFWAFTDCNGCRVMDQIVEHNCSCRIFSC